MSSQEDTINLRDLIINMSRKTKKQKLRARERRASNPEKVIHEQVNPSPLQKSDPHVEHITQHTKADLKKTLILAVFLFGLEFLFFYANLKGVSLK